MKIRMNYQHTFKPYELTRILGWRWDAAPYIIKRPFMKWDQRKGLECPTVSFRLVYDRLLADRARS